MENGGDLCPSSQPHMENGGDISTATTVDPRSGFCSVTKTFRSLRPKLRIPPPAQNISVTSYVFSLLPSLPDRPAFINATTGVTLSYADLRSQVRSLAAALRSPGAVGLSKGDVAFVLSPTCLEVPVLYLALLSVGAVICPSNPILTEKEIAHQVGLVKPAVAFVTSSNAKLLPSHVPAVAIDSPEFRSFLTDASEVEEDAVEVRQSDTAVILFSSGTSGKAKAAAASHRNYIAMIAGFHSARISTKESPDVMLLIAPMFHSLGFFFALKGVALGDTSLVMSRAGLLDMLRVVERYRATNMTTSPPLVVTLSRLEEAGEVDLKSLRRVVCGGAPLEETAARRFTSRFPWITIEQGYGSTEGGSITRLLTEEECRKVRSVGRLNNDVEAKVVDPATNEVSPVGKQGELFLKGPAVMKGYVGDDEATSACLDADGWLRTGDLCYFDQDGYLYVVDRIKELIKYKAYQVPPVELEQILLSLPEIVDAAVAPYPNEEAGQIPMAFVVTQQGSTISESELMAFVAKQVAPYKKIRKVAFVDSIPKTPSGKILRRELAGRALAGVAV